MNMKKITLASLMVAVIAFGVSTLASAEGVKVKDIQAKTTVTGAVTQAAIGDKNEQDLTIGGVSGNVEGDKIKLETTVTGAVTQVAVGDKNKQRMNIGGVTGH